MDTEDFAEGHRRDADNVREPRIPPEEGAGEEEQRDDRWHPLLVPFHVGRPCVRDEDNRAGMPADIWRRCKQASGIKSPCKEHVPQAAFPFDLAKPPQTTCVDFRHLT